MPLINQEGDSVPLDDTPSAQEPIQTPIFLSEKPRPASAAWKRYLIAALPEFARPGGFAPRKINSTSYLDALRGYAATIVFMAHIFNSEWGWQNEPIIRTFFQGHGMVALFFVISGYVLSYRFLIYMRTGEMDKFMNAIASSTFRRYIRLYLSVAFACFIALIVVRFKGYNGLGAPLWKDTLGEQLWDYFLDQVFFANPFSPWISGYLSANFHYSRYLGQMWSIAAEYRGSVALFAFLTGTCKLSVKNRMILTWIIIFFCYVWEACYIAEFLAGCFIADLSLTLNPERLTNPRGMRCLEETRRRSWKWKVICVFLFLLGFFLIGEPPGGPYLGILGPYPWHFLYSLIPWWWDPAARYLFWLGPGSVLLVVGLEFYPTLQKPFNWRFSQYVGDLSFGIYAMHPPIAWAVWMVWYPRIREQYLGDSTWAYVPGVILTVLAVFTASDYFSRIDRMVIRFARWCERKVFLDATRAAVETVYSDKERPAVWSRLMQMCERSYLNVRVRFHRARRHRSEDV